MISFEYIIFLIHILSTFYMIGIIWFVQVVHYPSFRFWEKDHFRQKENFHQMRTLWVVAPGMILELMTFMVLIILPRAVFSYQARFMMSGILLGLIWVITFFAIAPLHKKLEKQFDENDHNKLVKLNWFRSLFWTARGIILITLWFTKAFA